MGIGKHWRTLIKIIPPVLVMAGLWSGPTEAAPNFNQSLLNAESKYKLVAAYTGPKGITIKSYSGQWEQEEKLKRLYDELLANYHGVEIDYLSTVNIFPDYVYGPGVGGLYHGSFYNLTGSEERGYNKGRSIDLAAGDQNSTIDLMAKTLAHEYGHHFTMYYLWLKEGKTFDQWKETKWAKVRGLTNIPAVGNGEHMWAPEEIAADDYVQLFASPSARASADFQSQYGNFDNTAYNLSPQENLELPLAAQVPRLEEYWLGLLGVTPTKINLAPLAPTLALTGVEERSQRYKNLVFMWTKSIDDSSGPLEYTLITYRKGDTLATPVLTQWDGYQATYSSHQETGTRLFRLLVKDAEGKLSSSNVLEVNLDSPETGQLPEEENFRDVPRSYWAFRQIKELVQRKYLSGFPDATFRPEQAVTRAEFATLLVRVMDWEAAVEKTNGNNFTDILNHWAAGFVAQAREKGIVGGYENNTFRPEARVSRGEMAAMLARLLEREKLASGQARLGLVDIDNHWARGYISTVEGAGLVTGFPNGKFAPEAPVKRGELAVVFKRLLALTGK
ncbi:MAG: S-layer homology domain-containing protein [Carboxydocellales bacterium]